MTRTFSAVSATTVCALALLVSAGTASAALPFPPCESTAFLPLGAGSALTGDDFQAGDGDQCAWSTDAGPTGATLDWHSLVPNYPSLAGESQLLDVMPDNPVPSADYNNDPSVFGC